MENMEKNLIVVSIDSNHASDLFVDVVKDLDEAVATLLEREKNAGNEGLTVTTSEDGGKIRITLSDCNPIDEYFVVAEAFEAHKNYAVVWWHAYDGVSFDLKGSSDSIVEAQEMLDFYFENYYVGDENIVEVFHEDGEPYAKVVYNNEDDYLQVIDLSKEVAVP